jgi:hypothetical protein
MIRPSKYMDLENCVLSVAATIISVLKESLAMSISELDETIQVRIGKDARFNFFHSINFLYVTGKIDYDDGSDKIVLVFDKGDLT